MQPKRYQKPKIAMLNIELELKAERTNAEVRISSVADYEEVNFFDSIGWVPLLLSDR